MYKKSKTDFPWKMAIYPLFEIIFLILSFILFEQHLELAILCLLIAAIGVSFSVHIFFHECVHYANRFPAYFNYLASLLMGLPFDGYRIHHYNHHCHENSEHDFSTTWIYSGGTRKARSVMSYIVGWPRQLMASLNSSKR